MGNLFKHHLHFEGINIFVLARNKHGRHANNMQITDLTRLCFTFEIPVNQRHCQEKCLIVALKVGKYFNHPVYHTSSQGRGNLVFDQAILSEIL